MRNIEGSVRTKREKCKNTMLTNKLSRLYFHVFVFLLQYDAKKRSSEHCRKQVQNVPLKQLPLLHESFLQLSRTYVFEHIFESLIKIIEDRKFL